MGGEQQHQQNDDYGYQHDHLHLGGQAFRGGIAGVAGDVHIISIQQGLYAVQCRQAHLVRGSAVIGDGEQRRAAGIVALGSIKLHALYPLDGADLLRQGVGLLEGNIVHHDAAGPKGDKLIIHNGETLTGLGAVGQVAG